MLEFLNLKTFFLKVICQVGQKKLLVINKIKNAVPWTYLINDLNSKEIKGSFYEQELQKTDQKE